jgi:hypothetical protein
MNASSYEMWLAGLAVLVVVALNALAATDLPGVVVAYGRRRASASRSQQELARALGLPLGVWWTLVVCGPLVGLGFGLLLGLPLDLVILCGVIVGVSVPWFAMMRVEQVIDRRDEDTVALARDLGESRGEALGEWLRAAGHRSHGSLGHCLPALADESRPLSECLGVCAERARSGVMTELCACLMAGLAGSPRLARDLVPTTIVPYLEGVLRAQRARRRAVRRQRGIVTFMGILLVAFFSALYGLGAGFRTFFDGGMGGVTIVAVAIGFAFITWLVRAVMRVRRRPQWDVVQLSVELRRYGSVS